MARRIYARAGLGRHLETGLDATDAVMAGLVPAIHVCLFQGEIVDARHKAGHDEAKRVGLIEPYRRPRLALAERRPEGIAA